MKGVFIRALLEDDPFVKHHFDGIVTKESLPTIKRQQHFVILNADNHWIYLFRSNGTLECFDPLGWQEKHQDIFREGALMKDINRVLLSSKGYQPVGSDKCGEFCLYIAYKRLYMLDEPISHVLSEIFSDEPSENEKIVTKFYNTLLAKHLPSGSGGSEQDIKGETNSLSSSGSDDDGGERERENEHSYY